MKALDRKEGVRLSASELKAVMAALGERDETAEICRNSSGEPEADSELRDTESVPLKRDIHEYFKKEVLPHVRTPGSTSPRPRSVRDSLNRHFYVYGRHVLGSYRRTSSPLKATSWLC
jgi:type I restriction enzyme M protein